MPRFIGTLVPKELNQTAFKELYAFLIEPPPDAGYGPTTLLPAKVPLEISADEKRPAEAIRTCIAKNLAEEYGVFEAGQVIELVLWEEGMDGVSCFELPVEVYFAAPERGDEYIQIGTADLAPYFELCRCPAEKFLDLRLREGAERGCMDFPRFDPAAAGS